MATNPRVAAYEADKRAQNLYNSLSKPKPAAKPITTTVFKPGTKPPVNSIKKPVNLSMATNKPIPAGFSKPTAKPMLSIEEKKKIAAREPKPTMQQMLKKK